MAVRPQRQRIVQWQPTLSAGLPCGDAPAVHLTRRAQHNTEASWRDGSLDKPSTSSSGPGRWFN
jgi:hypothetical protein